MTNSSRLESDCSADRPNLDHVKRLTECANDRKKDRDSRKRDRDEKDFEHYSCELELARKRKSSRHVDCPDLKEMTHSSRLEHNCSADRPNLDYVKRLNERKNDKKEDRISQKRDRDEKDFEDYSCELELARKRKSSRRVDCPDLVHQGGEIAENLAIYNISASSVGDKSSLKSVYTQEFTFCDKVKEILHPNAYHEFLKCLHIYSKEIITRSELKNLVSDLLGKHYDLMDCFNEFLAHCENMDGFLADVFKKKPLWREGHLAKTVKVGDRDEDREHDRDDREIDRERETDKDRVRCDKGSSHVFKDPANNKVPLRRSNPSYRLLSPNHPMPATTQRTKLGTSVLNDTWVSVTPGSEDHTFKHMRKNQYEESLFKCEDDRFELDMLIESVNSTTKRVEKLLEEIQNKTLKLESPFHIEDHFTVLHLRCIERLYGDHGLDVMDVLRKNASNALAIILTRLKQKKVEWLKCRADFNKVWAEIYSKNHQKSLNHCSSYFKQQDTKKLKSKEYSELTKSNHTGYGAAAEARACNDVLPPLEGGDTARLIIATNGACIAKYSRSKCYHEGNGSQNEREEGELSPPNGDFEEDNFVAFENTAMDASTRQMGGSAKRTLRHTDGEVEDCGDTDAENDADYWVKDNTQRSTKDSKNASEARVHVSGRESGDECSHEIHEEQDADHDANGGIEGEDEGITDANDAEGELTLLPFSEQFLHAVKPLAKCVPAALQGKDGRCTKIFYGNDSFCVLFRLHQTFYEKILSANVNSAIVERKWRFSKDATTPDLYANLLNGTADNTKFEDDCRAIIGSQSYMLFTSDKLVYKVVKQLQAIVSNKMDNRLYQLYLYENSRRPKIFFDMVYHENARVLLHGESVYRFECSSNSTKISIQLMGFGLEKPEFTVVSIEPNFSSYLDNHFLSSISDRMERLGIFMRRNKRKFRNEEDKDSTYWKTLDGLQIVNGLECKIASLTSTVSYVLDTEDVLFPVAKRRRTSQGGLALRSQSNFLKQYTRKAQRFRSFQTMNLT